MKSNGNGPIVAVDIDGTLGDFHAHFLRFAEQWYGRPMPDPRDINPGLPLHKFMRTSKTTYRACKLAYRQGGLKRSMPVYDGASELCRAVRNAGAELWICTTRPYLRLDNIDPDTRHWLRRAGIAAYDGLIYGPSKYRDLARIVSTGRRGPGIGRVAAVLDDLPEMIDQADSLSMQTILRDQPYNRHIEHVWRVADMADAERAILIWIQKWKDDHASR